MDWPWRLHTHQWIGDVSVRGKRTLADNPGSIHRIGHGSLNCRYALLRAHNRHRGGIDRHSCYAISAKQSADNPRLHRHRSFYAAIEADVELRRHDLNDSDVAGNVDISS